MIHQLIFASPKPGMTEKDFQDYWVRVHAVEYASRIPQIRKYTVCTRVALPGDPEDPPFSGVAEIWLANEEEQLASLQSKEFLEGARIDEPRWAAFWATLALDTETHELTGPPPVQDSPWVKLFVLVKRRSGIPLQVFRDYALQVHAPVARRLPHLRAYAQCHVRDSLYAVGEPRFDAVSQLWFEDEDALSKTLRSDDWCDQVQPNLRRFVEDQQIFQLATREHWIIGPQPR